MIFFCFLSLEAVNTLVQPTRMVDRAMLPEIMMVSAIIDIVFAIILVRYWSNATFRTLMRLTIPLMCLSLFLCTCFTGVLFYAAYGLLFASGMIVTIFIWTMGILYGASRSRVPQYLGIPLSVHYGGAATCFLVGNQIMPAVDPVKVLFFLAILIASIYILTTGFKIRRAPLVEVRYRNLRQEALETIAHDFNLSSREGEVLNLFTRGRSAAYISEQLYISQSTVETHLKHIYEKVKIRSKQGLIDLVEAKEQELAERDAKHSA